MLPIVYVGVSINQPTFEQSVFTSYVGLLLNVPHGAILLKNRI